MSTIFFMSKMFWSNKLLFVILFVWNFFVQIDFFGNFLVENVSRRKFIGLNFCYRKNVIETFLWKHFLVEYFVFSAITFLLKYVLVKFFCQNFFSKMFCQKNVLCLCICVCWSKNALCVYVCMYVYIGMYVCIYRCVCVWMCLCAGLCV